MFKRSLQILGLIFLVLGLYLLLWPIPLKPVAWQTSAAPGYQGAHAVNEKLALLQHISIGSEVGPEHLAIGPDGLLYAAMASGNILRMKPDGSVQEVFANTQGRVLGFDFDSTGRLIAADAMRGLLSITPDKKVEVLTAEVDGDPIRYADAVIVAKNGKMYFSDASRRFGPKDWGGTFEASVLDILEQSSTGRVLEYDPSSKVTRVVAQGLSFANGVALSSDEQSLLVTETGKYRVWRIPVAAQKLDLLQGEAGGAKILLNNLPGYPDNLMKGASTPTGQAKYWLGFAKPRSAVVDGMATKPLLRSMTLRLPRALWPIPPRYGHVIAFTEDGKIVQDLQDPSGAYPETTAVTETKDKLYIQSLHAKTIGWLPN
jgi:hypothetical protein